MAVQTNMLVRFTSWKDWFNSRSSATIINKSNQDKLFKIFNSECSVEQCRKELEDHCETVFLFCHNFGPNQVDLFHNMTTSGGNLYTTNKTFAFIKGVGKDSSNFMTPDYDILTDVPHDLATSIPTASHLLNVTSVKDVDALIIGQTTSYKPRNFVPVPPFLLDTLNTPIISNLNRNTTEVLIHSAQAIKDFDTTHSGDAEYTDRAKSKSKDLLAWLYLVIQDKITATLKFLKLENTSLGSNKPPNTVAIHSNSLGQVLQRPLEILATSSSSAQEFLQKLTQIQSQSNDKSARSFKQLAPKYQCMLLVASSQGEAIPIDLNKDALDFFSQSSVLNAQIYLNSLLDSLKIECSASSALTTSLMHRSFLWASTLTPSGLASSVISSVDIIRTDALQEGIILDYSTKHEMSSKSLEKLTKTQILYPVTIDAAIERIRALHALVELFFGKLSFAEQGLKKLVNLCTDHKRLLRTKQYLGNISSLVFNTWLMTISING